MHDDELTEFANAFLQIRRSRGEHFPSELVEPGDAWDILLVLFVADSRSARLTARDAIAEAGGRMEIGRRWIKYLTMQGLVVGDGEGRLEDVVALTPAGIERLEHWLRLASSITAGSRPRGG